MPLSDLREPSRPLPTVHRQLLDWCRRRGFDGCESFVDRLDSVLAGTPSALTGRVLLQAFRSFPTFFFRQNAIDREEVAFELAAYLDIPPPSVELVQLRTGLGPTPVGNPSSAPDLFLSYYHDDRSFVDRLAKALADEGLLVWYDRVGITGGGILPREIESALELTRHVAVVCTSVSVERPWVRLEVDASIAREMEEGRPFLIPLMLEEFRPPLFLRIKKWCPFFKSFNEGYNCLRDVIAPSQ